MDEVNQSETEDYPQEQEQDVYITSVAPKGSKKKLIAIAAGAGALVVAALCVLFLVILPAGRMSKEDFSDMIYDIHIQYADVIGTYRSVVGFVPFEAQYGAIHDDFAVWPFGSMNEDVYKEFSEAVSALEDSVRSVGKQSRRVKGGVPAGFIDEWRPLEKKILDTLDVMGQNFEFVYNMYGAFIRSLGSMHSQSEVPSSDEECKAQLDARESMKKLLSDDSEDVRRVVGEYRALYCNFMERIRGGRYIDIGDYVASVAGASQLKKRFVGLIGELAESSFGENDLWSLYEMVEVIREEER